MLIIGGDTQIHFLNRWMFRIVNLQGVIIKFLVRICRTLQKLDLLHDMFQVEFWIINRLICHWFGFRLFALFWLGCCFNLQLCLDYKC